jgi:hypothetical protein
MRKSWNKCDKKHELNVNIITPLKDFTETADNLDIESLGIRHCLHQSFTVAFAASAYVLKPTVRHIRVQCAILKIRITLGRKSLPGSSGNCQLQVAQLPNMIPVDWTDILLYSTLMVVVVVMACIMLTM